jgi:cold shock CspA family protein
LEAENIHIEEKTKEERRIIGKIIKVSEEGWGFISSKEIKFTRIFFHWTSLKQDTFNFQDLKNGMKVEFTPVEVEGKGWRAIKIRVVTDEQKESKIS